MSEQSSELSQIAKQLISKYKLYNIEILREDYSTTIDWGSEMAAPIRIQLERMGFEVTHEESSIYTLQYTYE